MLRCCASEAVCSAVLGRQSSVQHTRVHLHALAHTGQQVQQAVDSHIDGTGSIQTASHVLPPAYMPISLSCVWSDLNIAVDR